MPVLVFALAATPSMANQQLMSRFAGMSCNDRLSFDESTMERVEPFVSTGTLTLEGPGWSNKVIDGCEIRGAKGSGIEIRNVENLTIKNCKIIGSRDTGIRLRSSGSTKNVRILNNIIINSGDNGISVAKRKNEGVDHTGLVIAWNKVIESGTTGKSGRDHGIYTQASDAVIFGNEIGGTRDGNGISVRSSGLIACNNISGVSRSGKPGIRYFANHYSGPTQRLIIANNQIRGASPAIELVNPDGWAKKKKKALVLDFVITNNASSEAPAVQISDFWTENGDVSLKVEGNFAAN